MAQYVKGNFDLSVHDPFKGLSITVMCNVIIYNYQPKIKDQLKNKEMNWENMETFCLKLKCNNN